MESKQIRLEKLRKWRQEKKFKERPPFKPAGSIKLGKYEVLQPPPITLHSRGKNMNRRIYKATNRGKVVSPQAKKNEDREAKKRQNNGLTKKNLSEDNRDSFAPEGYKFKGIETVTHYNLYKNIPQDKVQANLRSHPVKISHSLKENITPNKRDKTPLNFRTDLQNTVSLSTKKDKNKTIAKAEIEYRRKDIENNINKPLIQTSDKPKQNKKLNRHVSPKCNINNTTVILSDSRSNSAVENSSPNDCSFVTRRFKPSPCSSGVNSKTFCAKRMSKDGSTFSPLNHLNCSGNKTFSKEYLPKNINVGECSPGYALANVTNDMLRHNSTRRSSSRSESLDKSFHVTENTKKIKQALFSGDNFGSPTLDLSDEIFTTCLMSQSDTPSFTSSADATFTKDPEIPSIKLWRNSSDLTTDFEKEKWVKKEISRILKPLISED